MTQVVQATCPGCKSVLRIPANWVDQPIRCKNCGTVMQARPPAPAPSPAAPPALEKTPPPAPRQRVKPAPAGTPPPVPRPESVRPAAAPPPVPPPVAAPTRTTTRAPVALPSAAPVAAPTSTAAFSFEEPEAAPPGRTGRRARRRGRWWTGPLIAALVLLVAGGVTLATWPRLKAALAAAGVMGEKPDDPLVDGPDPEPRKDHPTATAHKSVPAGTPAKNKDPDPRVKGPGMKGPRDKGRTKPGPSRDPEEPQVPVVQSKDPFPRRTLFITVHNYLYANPIQNPLVSINLKQKVLDRVIDIVNSELRVPVNQTTHLSDMARKQPIPPMKGVIEKTLTDFLEQSRKQDRVMVFFVGHSAELNDKAYLVPVEGEMDNANTLIPLEWVYAQMAKCPARQKVLVLDAHRFNPGQGVERPNSGVMGPKFEALVKAPPEGVQVWAACGAGQMSYETDERPGGVFLDSIKFAFSPPKAGMKGVMAGQIQKPADLIPVEKIQETVTQRMAGYLTPRDLKQVAHLAGQEKENGAEVDPKETPAPQLVLAVPKLANEEVVKAVLDEASVPPLKVGQSDAVVSFNSLPPFSPDVLKKYEDQGPADSLVRKAIRTARANLWALSNNSAPADLVDEVSKAKVKMGGDLNLLQDRFTAPGAGPPEVAFKRKLEITLKNVSKLITPLEESLDELKEIEPLVKDGPKRWQAHFLFVQARVEEQLAILEEYEGALGQMRKEFPPRKEGDIGWRLAAKTKSTDGQGKKHDKSARKLLGEVVEKHAGTPWEVLAKREKLTSLGLEWKSTDGSSN